MTDIASREARVLIQKLASAGIDDSGTMAIGLTRADIVAAQDWLVLADEAAPVAASREALKCCPFCGAEARCITIDESEPNNAGGDVIVCTRCQASSHVEFGRKENLVSRWNTRALADEAASQPRQATTAAQALFEHEMRCRGVSASWNDVDEDERAGWQSSVDVVVTAIRSSAPDAGEAK